MQITVTDIDPSEAAAELVCVGLFEDEDLPEAFAGAPGADDARGGFRKLALLHPGSPRHVLAVGLGKRDDLTPERARVAAALAVRQARRLEASSLAWALPNAGDAAAIAAALVEGTELAAYRFDRFLTSDDEEDEDGEIESLELLSADDVSSAAEVAGVASAAANRARELQNLPSNVATPTFLADRARELADAHDSVAVEVLGREDFKRLGMGGLEAVSKGSDEEPALIVIRYSGGGGGAPLGFVGKAVTFDTGGISIKPSARMQEMKMDMSGGAAVLEATAAIAELGLGLELISVIPSTENMPSGHAVKPGDIITQLGGKTVEVNNTDAEGRLILADALAYCVELGAERIVDLATLTGAVLVALGSTYAALISNDDDWAERVRLAGEATGELAWRLPLHPEYKELTKGSVADLTNASEKRKAGTIYAASFLEEFVDETAWAHLDIAGTAWDVGREYVGKGATGYGVRLLVELAGDIASS
ncbi:MAG: leucyl aminopeptidase [Solirubrobacterales bacterium]